MSEPVFPEPVIVPLDELERRLAFVPLEVVREVLARQGLIVVGREAAAVLAAVDGLQTSTLVWYRSSGPFWRVCRAALAMRKADER